MLIYTAGPYRAYCGAGSIEGNIAVARDIALEVWKAGHVAACPHMNTAFFEQHVELPDEVYLKGDFEILARCDAILMIPGWEGSDGSVAELAFAKEQGIPIYYYETDGIPPLNPTEVACPQQCRGFMNTIMRMYRIHLSKNHDYSPANLLVTGELGLVTRLWDKTARLLNLTGFKFDVTNARYEAPKNPKHESIEDTLIDAAVYPVLGMLIRQGVWGR